MKLLLDENLPKKLKNDFSEYVMFTVREKGWTGKTNGELLKLMIDENFDALLTFDKNLQHQQNFIRYNIAVLILSAPDNTYSTLLQLVPKIKSILKTGIHAGPIEIVL
jgi:predicted nuclease of predicted toxin-antitoxin system